MKLLSVLALCALSACVVIAPRVDPDAEVLVIGDSILAWHRGKGASIPAVVEDQTQRGVTNQAIAGATFIGSRGIPSQFASGDWDIVLMNGGGNDIGDVCGTSGEAAVLNRLISPDGTQGAIPDFVRRVRATGADVIWLGYYPISVEGGPFAPCRVTLDQLKARQQTMARILDGVTFVDTADVIAPDNLALYDGDLVHPSVDGAARIGVQVASVVRQLP
ncbi:SGNH/GDSL hydrolase family protein [Pseudooctadecabacter sp.]|uniref:SGNH/GDSL hydrolase family protein n=1 Tax=Pseudooctadecabacter sp. TaxID=1966338 RepID=UPI0035C84CCB